MVLFYKTDKFEGALSSSEEGEVHWIELEDMKKMNLADRMDKVLEVFLNEKIILQIEQKIVLTNMSTK